MYGSVMIKNILIKAINLYQKTLSPDHGINSSQPNIGCRFYPTCSEYAKLSLQKDPLPKSLLKIIYRILRCNPFSKGGIDKP